MDYLGQTTRPVVISPSESAFNAVRREVAAFQARLGARHEIGISVNGTDNIIHVETMQLSGQMVVFDGSDNHGRPARLVQHYTQTNIQMIAVEALSSTPRRIGF